MIVFLPYQFVGCVYVRTYVHEKIVKREKQTVTKHRGLWWMCVLFIVGPSKVEPGALLSITLN